MSVGPQADWDGLVKGMWVQLEQGRRLFEFNDVSEARVFGRGGQNADPDLLPGRVLPSL